MKITEYALLVFAGLAILAAKANADTIINDDFSGGTPPVTNPDNSVTRTPVAGRIEPVSGATYYGSMDYDGTTSANTYAQSFGGQDDLGLPFNSAAYASLGNVYTLNVDYQTFYPHGNFETGFARATDTLGINGSLWLNYVPDSHTYQVYDDGSNLLATGSINLNSGIHDIQLTYDLGNQVASLSIDGTQLVNDVSTAGNFTNAISDVYSFSNFNASAISGLEVDVSQSVPLSTPEPSTTILMGASLVALISFIGFRRRAKDAAVSAI